MNFYESWQYLSNHKTVQYDGLDMFKDCLEVEVVKVNPLTNKIDDNNELNTKTKVWLEFGKIIFDKDCKCPRATHDTEFDCGADTFEDAVVILAELVKKKYKEVEKVTQISPKWISSKEKIENFDNMVDANINRLIVDIDKAFDGIDTNNLLEVTKDRLDIEGLSDEQIIEIAKQDILKSKHEFIKLINLVATKYKKQYRDIVIFNENLELM